MCKVENLITCVENVFNVRMKDVLAKLRTRSTSDARQVICHVCHKDYKMENNIIARIIERDPQTVAYNLVCHMKKMAKDEEYKNKFNKLKKMLQQ